MLKLYCRAINWKAAMMNRLREEKGSHTVEIVIFIAIAVGLAFIFREQIGELIKKVFKSADGAVDELAAKS